MVDVVYVPLGQQVDALLPVVLQSTPYFASFQTRVATSAVPANFHPLTMRPDGSITEIESSPSRLIVPG